MGDKGATRGKVAGYILGAIAAASYGLNPTFALPPYAAGMNPDSVLLLRYGLAIPMLAVMILLRDHNVNRALGSNKKANNSSSAAKSNDSSNNTHCNSNSSNSSNVKHNGFKLQKRSVLPLFYLGLLMALSSLALFYSYKYMAAGIASTMLFVYPLMVAIIMAIFCHEKISLKTMLCILLACSGIMMLYKTPDGGTLSLVGTLIVMVSALSYAIYLVAINQKRLEGVDSLTVTFYVLVFGTLLFIARLAGGAAEFHLPGAWYLWLDTLALSLFTTVISLVCTTRAIQLIGSTPTAILGALEPVTAVVMGMLLFHEHVTVRTVAGIAMILLAVSYTVVAKKNKQLCYLLILLTFAGCGSGQKSAPEHSVTAFESFKEHFSNTAAYAYTTVSGYQVLLVSQEVFGNNPNTELEAVEASVFALDPEGKIVSLGSIRSQGTLYPVSLHDGKLMVAGHHFVKVYSIRGDVPELLLDRYEERSPLEFSTNPEDENRNAALEELFQIFETAEPIIFNR